MSRKTVWRNGENIAAEFLENKGYKIVARNYRTQTGEIDIIAFNGNRLTFIEVKTRKTETLGPPEYSITRAKITKIRKVASQFIKREKGGLGNLLLSFEVVAVDLTGEEPVVRHIRNIFTEM